MTVQHALEILPLSTTNKYDFIFHFAPFQIRFNLLLRFQRGGGSGIYFAYLLTEPGLHTDSKEFFDLQDTVF